MTTRKVIVDAWTLVVGLGSSVLTARLLGAGGKGVLATLVFCELLIAQLATYGLGDALLYFVRSGASRLQDARRAALRLAVPTALGAGAVYVVVLGLAFPDDRPAVAIMGAGIPVTTASILLTAELYAADRLRLVVVLTGLLTTLTGALAVIALVVLRLDVEGAVAAQVLAASILLVALVSQTHGRRGRRAPPAGGGAGGRGFLRPALRYGAKTQLAALTTQVAGRADLLVVAAILGAASAGRYSVALTVVSVASTLPFAVIWVASPGIASAAAGAAREMVASMTRTATAVAALTTPLLMAAAVVVVAPAFGAEFRDAVVPAVILCAGVSVNAVQWSLGRAAALRGAPDVLLRSWVVNAIVMLGLDGAAVPLAGLSGAAVASVLGTCAGAYVTWRWARGSLGLSRAELLPGRSDVRLVGAHLARVVRPARLSTG